MDMSATGSAEEIEMLVTTVKQQRAIGKAARSVGGYFELARRIANDRDTQKKQGAATKRMPSGNIA